jgi:hypothetical protein
MKRYGVCNPTQNKEIMNKVIETKRKRHTFNSSKLEDDNFLFHDLAQMMFSLNIIKTLDIHFAVIFTLNPVTYSLNSMHSALMASTGLMKTQTVISRHYISGKMVVLNFMTILLMFGHILM